MNPIRILILALLIYLPLTSSAITVKGYVFIDKNGNGVRDKNESGAKDVIVSDQVTTTLTNAEGFYQFESSQNFGFLFISQPSGFAVKGLFWKPIPKNQTEVTADFALYPIAASSKFTFIHASDTHIS